MNIIKVYPIIYTIHNTHLVHVRMKMGDHPINRLHTDFVFQSQFPCNPYLNIFLCLVRVWLVCTSNPRRHPSHIADSNFSAAATTIYNTDNQPPSTALNSTVIGVR